MRGEWPLVGRSQEIDELAAVLTGPDRRAVVVCGPAGVGKTRLAREWLARAEREGFATARATATRAARGLPFGALAPLLPPVDAGEFGATADRADLLRRFADALVDRARPARLALLVDDAHLLDDASAALLHQMAAGDLAALLVTYRTGEAAPDAVQALWKDGLADRMDLGGLSAEAVEELLEGALGGMVDRASAAHLGVRCQGNVLFLRELVLGAVADGTLVEQEGIWRITGPLSPSDRLVELVEARLGALGPAERAMLELLSFGEPMGPAELERLGDPTTIAELERKGLVTSRRDERRLEVRLAHPIYSDVLRARTPAVQVPALARALAGALEATGGRRREDALRLATWCLEGHESRPDVLLLGARAARWRYDFPLAETLARAAVGTGAGFEAALLATQLASLGGRPEEADEGLRTLLETASDDAQRGIVTVTRLDNYAFAGRIDEGLKLAEEMDRVITDPAWRDEIAVKRCLFLAGRRGPRAALEAAEPLLERASGRVLVGACLAGAYALCRLGRLDQAAATAQRGRAEHAALDAPLEWYPWLHFFHVCETLAHRGRLDAARQLAAEQYDEAVAAGSPEMQCFFAWLLVRTVGDRGDVDAAVVHGREAVLLSRQLGRPQLMGECLVSLALALALSGRAAAAADALAEFDGLGLGHMFFGVDSNQARAWTAVAAGDLPAARAHLRRAADLGAEIGDLVGATSALHGLARLGHAGDVAGELGALATRIEGDLARARADHAAALARQDPDALEVVSTRFETMSALLLAAEASAHATAAWTAAGEPRRAAVAGRNAASLAGRCPGATTPALEAVEQVGLTPAERDAALLAAAGRSNKEIADELCLSVRTIENRLQRVYQKLGVSSRAELGRVLGRPGSAGRGA